MAVCRPDLSDFQPVSLGEVREREVLTALASGLPESYTVFHSVGWSMVVGEGRQHFGEIDAVVLAPGGDLVLLEIKAGPVEFTAQGMRKRYNDRVKDVRQQVQMQFGALRQRLKEAGLREVWVGSLLVLPDQRVTAGSLSFPRERIVDKDDYPTLCERVLASVPRRDAHYMPPADREGRVSRLLDDWFEVASDPGARIGWLKASTRRLASGLATWAPRLRLPNHRLKVQAAAGAGKTQLALAVLGRSGVARPRYLCFNRPLADRMRQLCPQAEVLTVHELALRSWQAAHGAPDFARGSAVFEEALAHWLRTPGTADCAALVIDESQDFDAPWIDRALADLAPHAQGWVLGDEAQRLTPGRRAWQREDCALLDCPDNFRSPRAIVQAINALGLAPAAVHACSNWRGEAPGFHVWPADDDHGLATTEAVVAQLLAEGVEAGEIAVLSLHGRERSRLLRCDRLAGLPTRRFLGYSDAGDALWSDGAILVDTVYRFKGQAASAVVLAEIDFDELTAHWERLLYVGLTRAQWRAECVLAKPSEQALMRRLLPVDGEAAL